MHVLKSSPLHYPFLMLPPFLENLGNFCKMVLKNTLILKKTIILEKKFRNWGTIQPVMCRKRHQFGCAVGTVL